MNQVTVYNISFLYWSLSIGKWMAMEYLQRIALRTPKTLFANFNNRLVSVSLLYLSGPVKPKFDQLHTVNPPRPLLSP